MIPYIAAGDNLNLPFVGQLLRGGGAFSYADLSAEMHYIHLYSKNIYTAFYHAIRLSSTSLKVVVHVPACYHRRQACLQ